MTARFEDGLGRLERRGAVAIGSLGGRRARRARVRGRRAGETVLCPSNTFMATPLAIIRAGGEPVFVDCNRDDLCMSFDDFEAQGRRAQAARRACSCTSAATSRSRVERIAALCARRGHLPARGLRARARRRLERPAPGDVGRRRRLLVLRDQDRLDGRGRRCSSRATTTCSSYARAFRNYGKPDHEVAGLNFRMSEFTAALGARPDRAHGGDRRAGRTRSPASSSTRVHPGRLELPDGMTSGLYKYIVFDPIERSTGKVYDEPCHRIMGTGDDLPNTDWVGRAPLVRPALLPQPGGRAHA